MKQTDQLGDNERAGTLANIIQYRHHAKHQTAILRLIHIKNDCPAEARPHMSRKPVNSNQVWELGLTFSRDFGKPLSLWDLTNRISEFYLILTITSCVAVAGLELERLL